MKSHTSYLFIAPVRRPRLWFPWQQFNFRIRLLLMIFALALAAVNTVCADTVIMDNGDRISGRFVRKDGDVLKFRTPYAGTLKIDWEQIHEVQLDAPVSLLLEDSGIVEVVRVVREGTRLKLYRQGHSRIIEMDPSRVKVMHPEAWELGTGHKFEGRVNFAFKAQRGNTDKNDLDLDFGLKYRRRWDYFQSNGQLEIDSAFGQATTNKWTWMNKYERHFPNPWYGSAWLVVRRDRFSDLNFQSLVGPSVGYRFYAGKSRNLRSEIGVFHLHQEFSTQENVNNWGLGGFLEYDEMIWQDWLQFYHRQYGYIGVFDDPGKQLWHAWTGLRASLVAGFVGSVEYEIEYDSKPAVDTLTTDTTLRLKLGYEW